MGFPGSSGSPCQWKSVSLRTNEEFIRLYDDITEGRCRYFPKSPDVDYNQTVWGRSGYGRYVAEIELNWAELEEKLWDVDRQLKKVEKNTLISEVLAGIMLQFKQNIIPVLGECGLFFNCEYCVSYGFAEKATISMSDQQLLLQDLVEALAECVSSGIEAAHKVVVSALALLSFVYQYLIGCVDKGGSISYSPGSVLFRLIFVAIVLFLGSYVWIKFRQAAYTANRRKRKLGDESDIPGNVYTREVKNASGAVTHCRYEPRFKPLREKLESGASLELNRLSLGSYATLREAEIVLLIAAVLYGEVEVRAVEFEDGIRLPFPSVTESEQCPPCGEEKAAWVTHKTKQLYAQLVREKASGLQVLHPAVETDSHHGQGGEARRSDPSPSAPGAPSTAIELTCSTPAHGRHGVVEKWATSESHGSRQEAPVAQEEFSVSISDCDFDQFMSSMSAWEEKCLPAMDDRDEVVGDYSETVRVFDFEPPVETTSDIPTFAFTTRLPQLCVGNQSLDIVEPHLNSTTAIPFPQLESLPEQVQLQVQVTCQEQRSEELSGSNVELQQRLLESEVQISELQKKLRQAEVENEKWRSMFCELAKLV